MQATPHPTWNKVIYSDHSPLPEQRWGHKLLKINDHQLLLFGGFGGKHSDDGQYLNDLWTFNSHLHQWHPLHTTGAYPEARSNYTIHHNQIDNEVLIFGGGSLSKQRFNSLCILNLNTLVWRKVVPCQNLAAPWERTYHSGEFIYPYLVVFGGEGVANMDLDDTWTYNILTNQWNELQFEQGPKPSRRRFHGSALINNQMYVIGGCYGNYLLLGDIYKVDLSPLLQKNEQSGFKWEKVEGNLQVLERWGHSCNVFQNKIYIFGGRISLSNDSNELFQFDPSTNLIRQIAASAANIPKPRRRHASIMLGHSLLIFGGYDGEYLKDFNFITLQQHTTAPQTNRLPTLSPEAVTYKTNGRESHPSSNLILFLKRNNSILGTVRSDRRQLEKNDFFKNMLKNHNGTAFTIDLPAFSDLFTFDCLHRVTMGQELNIAKDLDFATLASLALTLEYYCSTDHLPLIEHSLLSRLNAQNSLKMLQLAILLDFSQLQHKSAQTYLRNHYNGQTATELSQTIQPDSDLRKIQQYLSSPLPPSDLHNKKQQVFASLLQNLHFDLEQTHLRKHNTNFLCRAANRLKHLFVKPTTPPHTQTSQIPQTPQKSTPKISRVARMLHFVTSFCSSDLEQQNNE